MTAADDARAAWARKADETEQARREARENIQHEAQQVRNAWQAYTAAAKQINPQRSDNGDTRGSLASKGPRA